MHNFDENQNRSGQNPDAPPIPGASSPPRARPEVLRTFGRVQLSGKTLESTEAALKAGSLSLLYKSKEREPAAADAGTRHPPKCLFRPALAPTGTLLAAVQVFGILGFANSRHFGTVFFIPPNFIFFR